SRRLRREAGMIPAIMFGGAKNKKPVSLTLEHKEVFKASESSSFYSSVLTIDVEGKEESVILKDMQRHPAKQEIMHVDFQRVTKSNPISILVPIKFLNETTCPAVKIGGGRISHQMSEVVITCLAADIPEFVAIDMQEIEIG
ncbi:MAG TPA: 50S ribosomal protein L25, partial [Oceanospirillaceae bacterium]|nr:50S ribosomal protein L25 [Oceanospirillaceae bacterium]